MRLSSPLLSRRLDLVFSVLLALAVGTVFRRLLGSGFFHDDWTFLARAAGILPTPDILARPLGFNLYWRALRLVSGHEPVVYTISRVLLHFAAGIVLARIVRRLGADVLASWLAAAFYLLSPLAFEALYWASGVVDLLANLGLLVAMLGVVRGDRFGVLWLAVGGLINLASKETGWWLPVAGVAAWRWHRRREYLWAAGLLAFAAAISVAATARSLSHDYTWSFSAVPWNLLRAGSWLVPRPDDLIRVWEADRSSLAPGIAVWLAWTVWATLRMQRGDWLPAAVLTCALLALVPGAGLTGHMVPRYLLPVQACLAAALVVALPQRWLNRITTIILMVVAMAIFTNWSVNQFLDRTYAKGRPSHRMVAKELMVRTIWRYLNANGVGPETGLVFLCRLEDDVAMREYMLDVIGRTWGPRVVLGSRKPVIITDSIAEIPVETPVFQFKHWSLEYLGVLRQSRI